MPADKIYQKRAKRLKWLFIIMILLVSFFLFSIFRIIHSNRHIPPHTSVIHNRALRGSIISEDNFTLSRSNKSFSASIYEPCLTPSKKELFIKLFSIYSDMNISEINKAFYTKSGKKRRGYITLNNKIDASTAIYLKELADKFKKMGIFHPVFNKNGVPILQGLDIVENGELREFPLKDTLTPALGYVRSKIIGKYRHIYGIKGLEKEYDKYLNSTINGVIRGRRDVYGNIIYSKSTSHISRIDGDNLHINISIALQKRVEKILDKMVDKIGAQEIIAGVMDSKTGKLIALASSQRYNPAHITSSDISKLNPKFTEYPYEPGSVIKPLTLATALELNRVTPNTIFPTYNGRYRLSRRFVIHDDEPFPNLSATDIIVHSSNIGITQISKLLSGAELHNGLANFGLGKPSGIDLPRDLPGRIRSAKALDNFVNHATQAYGYGLQATFMQLLKAHNVFNNDGIMVTPHLINYLENFKGIKFIPKDLIKAPTRVISQRTAKEIHNILIQVVKRGTGVKAQYPGLEIGGKTGTARIVSKRDYSKEYHSSFYGFANDNKGDKYEIGVLVIKASKYHKYFASQSAVPTFRKIVDALVELEYLKPNLTAIEKEKMLEQKIKREAKVKEKQKQRTQKLKEQLREQRAKMRKRRKTQHKKRKNIEKRPSPAQILYNPPVNTPNLF